MTTANVPVFKDEAIEKSLKKFKEGGFTLKSGFPTLSGDDIDPAWDEGLDNVLFMMSGYSVFMSSLAFKCRFHWSWALPTAGAYVHNATFNIVINPYFFFETLGSGLVGDGYRNFVLIHEVCHIFFEHMDRAKESGFDPTLWNVACDFYINLSIEEMTKCSQQQFPEYCKLIPKEIFPLCLDEKYRGKTEEEIYKLLEEKAKQNGKGYGEGTGDPKDDGGSFDCHGESTNDSSDTANQQAAAEKVRAAIVAAEQSGRQIGAAEGNLMRRFHAATEPKVAWQNELAEYVISTATDLRTYAKYNRRSSDSVLFSSKTGDSIRIFFGIDTSGSMSDSDLAEGGRELQGIMNLFGDWECYVASCDTKAFKVAQLSSEEDGNDLSTIKMEMVGGGGTDMAPMVQLCQEEVAAGEPIDVMIIFTDGYIPEESVIAAYEREIPCLFLITENGGVPSSLESAGIRIIKMD